MLNEDLYKKHKRALKRYRKNRTLIDNLEEKLVKVDERILKIKSTNFNSTGGGRGKIQTIEDLIADKDDLERRINNLCQKGRQIKREVADIIDTLEEPQQAKVLEMFFIECKSIEIIADELAYNQRHVVRLFNAGINNIVNIENK